MSWPASPRTRMRPIGPASPMQSWRCGRGSSSPAAGRRGPGDGPRACGSPAARPRATPPAAAGSARWCGAAATTSLPSISPKPPGSRKSRCMSMISSATCARIEREGIRLGRNFGHGAGRPHARDGVPRRAMMLPKWSDERCANADMPDLTPRIQLLCGATTVPSWAAWCADAVPTVATELGRPSRKFQRNQIGTVTDIKPVAAMMVWLAILMVRRKAARIVDSRPRAGNDTGKVSHESTKLAATWQKMGGDCLISVHATSGASRC